jgi:hypothetical protein
MVRARAAKAIADDLPNDDSGTHPVSRRGGDRITPSYDLSEYARAALSEEELTVDGEMELDRNAVPRVVMLRDEISQLELDHREGFLLSLIDGVSNIEALLDVCAMPEEDALITLYELLGRRVIALA